MPFFLFFYFISPNAPFLVSDTWGHNLFENGNRIVSISLFDYSSAVPVTCFVRRVRDAMRLFDSSVNCC